MPVESPEEFFEVLVRSRLLEPAELARARNYIQRPGRPSALKVAQWLVRKNLVTVWQAERLLGGYATFFLGSYRFVDFIAEGAMGVVFKAQHHVMGRIVAVKVLSKARLSHPNAIARFLREVQAMGALDHQNIVTAFDAGQVGDVHYLVMEFIDGADLNAWIEKHGKIPIPWACEFIRQAALGLHHAHERSMVHRDIKPANILVAWHEDQNRPVVKLLDLGLARALNEADAEPEGDEDDTEFSLRDPSSSQLTHAGTIVGTPDYLAPEQIEPGGDVDARTDIFSLGCTLFKLLTGELPYSGPDLIGKLQARISPTAPPAVKLRTLLPEADERLEEIVATMLARDPNDRYKTAAEVAQLLAEFAHPPQEKWDLIGRPETPHRDSSEVGSSQMVADPKLRKFFGELESEQPPPVAQGMPTIQAEGQSSPRAAPLAKIPDAPGDAEESDGSISGVIGGPALRKWRRALLWAGLALGAAMLLFLLWRFVFHEPRAVNEQPTPPAWPDRDGLLLAWRSAWGSSDTFLRQHDQPPFKWTRYGDVDFDSRGWLHFPAQDEPSDEFRGFAVHEAEGPLISACKRSGQLSLELVFVTEKLQQSGPARIVTFSAGPHERNFTLGQQGDWLVFRLRTTQPEENLGETDVKLCRLPSAGPNHLIVSYRPGDLAVYLNGRQVRPAGGIKGDLGNWTPQFLVIGDEWRGGRPWSGRIQRLAIYSQFVSPQLAARRFQTVLRETAEELSE